MQAYISISFTQRPFLNEAVTAIKVALLHHGIDAFVFVDRYHFEKDEAHAMMQQAFADIDRAGLLIAETSDKAIGIGIEAGYAKAKGKPVIYLRHVTAEHSTTLAGTSDQQVIYENALDLEIQLKAIVAILLQPGR
jgi:nucleoside 2-deoxyribosyltransferase